jgi:hypothetical protein
MKCKGCENEVLTVGIGAPGTADYGYCGYACMYEHVPESFGGKPTDLIEKVESPAKFHRRKMDELEKLCRK